MMQKKRYVQVGVGSRSEMYSYALVDYFKDTCELVGLCDSNPGRLKDRLHWVRKQGAAPRAYATRTVRPDDCRVPSRYGDCHQ
jgi:hypothetical protein